MKSSNFLPLFFCLSAIALLSTSCEIETLKDKYEDRIIGIWEFEEVKKLKLFDNQTITDDYEETLLEFMPDRTVNILDKNAMTVLASGTWDMDDTSYSDGTSTNSYVTLETRFDDNYNGVDYTFEKAAINRFKNSELCFQEGKFSKNKRVELRRD